MSGPCFDRIAIADWSARAAPATGADSIWIAVHDKGRVALTNPSTRRAALDQLAGLATPGMRTLLGVDFSLGYPEGTAEACGLTGVAWRSMWSHLGAAIVDDEGNANNRFEVAARLNRAIGGPEAGPFWGCPPRTATDSLTSTKPQPVETSPVEWRHVEARLRDDGHRPFSSWQLLGAGAVGGQSLVGIAALERLRWNLGDRLAIWPFTTGLDLVDVGDDVQLIVAEVWPSLWDVVVPVGTVKDAAQVESTARRLAALDADGALASWFSPQLDPVIAAAAVEEEGWVLGVPGRVR